MARNDNIKPDDDVPDFDAPDFDAIVVGAGFAGLYALYKLRQQGFSARAFEAGGDVGGTWYWNRYPGARCDIESMFYSYQFDDALQQDWTWSERYSPQPEILAYANHVADRFDLRGMVQFDTRVTSATWDDAAGLWTVETDGGANGRDRVSAHFFILGTGNLSSAQHAPDRGPGKIRRPDQSHRPLAARGRGFHRPGRGRHRHGIIGHLVDPGDRQAGPPRSPSSSARPTIRSPPGTSRSTTRSRIDIKANYKALREKAAQFFSCNILYPAGESPLEVDEATRAQDYEGKWREGGLGFIGTYRDLLLSDESNQTAADFVRAKIRKTVNDPAVAELLCPTNTIGCKRLCVDTDYYDTFNRENVHLVSVADTPIEKLTPEGVVVGGKTYAVDAIVFATGFDAMTGAILKIDIRGRDGQPIQDTWDGGPRTYLGLGVAGFPNMFTITGPGSPSVLANMIPAIEQHVDFILACMDHLRGSGKSRIEAGSDAQDAWVDHVNEVADLSLRATCNSWYVGANVPGKPRVFMPYIGGFPAYCEKCDAVAAAGYEGFAIS